MATTTTNYAFTKPAIGEEADVTVLNANMDSVDSNLKSVSDVANAQRDKAIASKYLNASQVLADNTLTSLADGEVWTEKFTASSGSQCAVSAAGVISFTTNGLYRIKAKVTFDLDAAALTGYCQVRLYNDSAAEVARVTVQTNVFGTEDTTVLLDEEIEVATSGGDITSSQTLHLRVYQTNTTATTPTTMTLKNGATVTYLTAEYLRAL